MTTATWYHASLKPISRSAGRSVVACAAYRTGSRMEDERYAAVRDFSRKADVVTSFTLAPQGAPAWATDAEALWNAVEAKENRKNSQLAFEWEVALPNELDAPRREAIARRFSGWLVEEYGVAVTTGIHEGGNRGNGLNDHMHVMMTTRELDERGWARNKLREFSTPPGKPNPEVERVRGQIADFINDALEDAGSDERVDPRSFAARGIEREPTKHLGPAATAMERADPDRSDRGDINRAILEERLRWQMEQAAPEITAGVERDLAARFGDPEPPAPDPEAARIAQLIEEAQAAGPVPVDVVEHATAGMQHVSEDVAEGGRTPPPAPRGWIARLRALAADLQALWHDEGSGEPQTQEPSRDREEPEAQPQAPQPETGWQRHLKSVEVQFRTFAGSVLARAVGFRGNERGAVPDSDPLAAYARKIAGEEPQSGQTPFPAPDIPPEPDGPDMS